MGHIAGDLVSQQQCREAHRLYANCVEPVVFRAYYTNLTLWQIVPLLLTGRIFLKGGLRLPRFAQPVVFAVGCLLSCQQAMR